MSDRRRIAVLRTGTRRPVVGACADPARTEEGRLGAHAVSAGGATADRAGAEKLTAREPGDVADGPGIALTARECAARLLHRHAAGAKPLYLGAAFPDPHGERC